MQVEAKKAHDMQLQDPQLLIQYMQAPSPQCPPSVLLDKELQGRLYKAAIGSWAQVKSKHKHKFKFSVPVTNIMKHALWLW